MFKKIIIIILIVLIGFFAFYYLKPFFQTSPQPEEVVEDFYSFWMSYPEEPGGNPIAERAYQSRDDVTESLIYQLDEVVNSFAGGPGYDPVLCSQDFPAKISFKETEKKEDLATVMVEQDFYGSPKSLMVSLKLIDGVWKIDEIDCLAREHFYTEEQSRQIAELWLINYSPTYRFDGINFVFKESLALDLVDCEDCYQFVYDFESSHAGYGDRTGEILAQVITPHTIVITVENGEVTQAIIDEVYDDFNQEII
jgi:hypothetical protein